MPRFTESYEQQIQEFIEAELARFDGLPKLVLEHDKAILEERHYTDKCEDIESSHEHKRGDEVPPWRMERSMRRQENALV